MTAPVVPTARSRSTILTTDEEVESSNNKNNNQEHNDHTSSSAAAAAAAAVDENGTTQSLVTAEIVIGGEGGINDSDGSSSGSSIPSYRIQCSSTEEAYYYYYHHSTTARTNKKNAPITTTPSNTTNQINDVRTSSTTPPPPITASVVLSHISNNNNNSNAQEVNQQLNLNLGQTFIQPNHSTLLLIIQMIDSWCFQWYEKYLFDLWAFIPIQIRKQITFLAWSIYYPIHQFLFQNKTGIHRDASYEYHALTTVMYWNRYLPMSIQRMRFGLSQLSVCTATSIQSAFVEDIHVNMRELWEQPSIIDSSMIPDEQNDFCHVHGLYVHHHQNKQPTEYILFWVYGGAFLAGDIHGNLGPAERMGYEMQMDIFIPQYRLCPEGYMNDIIWDITLAYQYICTIRQTKYQQDPTKIILCGISSGGGLCVRLMQAILEKNQQQLSLPHYIQPFLPTTLPCGAILMGPFVDYTEPPMGGSLINYALHDLIVTPAVLQIGLPYMKSYMHDQNKLHSPIYRSMKGLPPLCIIVSEHEAIYDQALSFIYQARLQHVHVTVGIWKYMCHVFSLLFSFIPEGEQSIQFAMQWTKQLIAKQRQQEEQQQNTTE